MNTQGIKVKFSSIQQQKSHQKRIREHKFRLAKIEKLQQRISLLEQEQHKAELAKYRNGYMAEIDMAIKRAEVAERYDFNIPEISDVILNRYIKDILKRLSEEVPSLQKTEITKLTMCEREMEERGDAEFMRNEDGDVIKYRYDLVTSHTARRSGITNLYLTGLFDTVQMMSISGHKDQRTFFDYIKLSSDEIADKIMEKLRQSENIGNEGLF